MRTIRGNCEKCGHKFHVVFEGYSVVSVDQDFFDFLEMPLDEIECSTRLKGVFERNDLNKLKDLEGKTKKDLFKMKNFGNVSFKELVSLIRQLKKINFELYLPFMEEEK